MKRFKLTLWGFSVGMFLFTIVAWQGQLMPKAVGQYPTIGKNFIPYRVNLSTPGTAQSLVAWIGVAPPAGHNYVLVIPESGSTAYWSTTGVATTSSQPVQSFWGYVPQPSNLSIIGTGYVDISISP